ncbi:MAG: phosphoglycerate dehydrogenase [Thermoguttaceae bacterium]|jgi:D-3-phosphoglycerate dehydrogenase
MPQVIILDELPQAALDLLESAGDIEYEVHPGLAEEPLRSALLQFEGAICGKDVPLPGHVLEGNRRLKAIVRAGAETDNIDLEAASRMGIVVMNTPGGDTLSVAEHTIALMLALSRNVHPAYCALLEGRWQRKQYLGTQVAGKTLGIVGLGRVGQAVATRALALGMRVLGYDPLFPSQRAKALGIGTCPSIRELLPEVDYLTIDTPLNDATRDLIGGDEIRSMRRGARLINCARGGLLDEQALVAGLQSGQLGGVALDVFESEPCTQNALFGMPNVLCTPHLGADTREAQSLVAVEAAGLLIDFFSTGAVRQPVNVLPTDPQTLESLRGYLDVAYRLGLLSAQLGHSPPTGCRLRYQGEVAGKDTRLLSAAFIAGLLEHALDRQVNLVNAELLLRDRGIELVEQRSFDLEDFTSLITAELTREQGTSLLAGTLFGNTPLLVRRGDCWLESRLEGVMLLTRHRDVPGVIGSIGEVFGSHQVNIAYLSVGRRMRQPGGQAAGVFALDSIPPAAAVAEIAALGPVEHACVVKLPPAGRLPSWMGG